MKDSKLTSFFHSTHLAKNDIDVIDSSILMGSRLSFIEYEEYRDALIKQAKPAFNIDCQINQSIIQALRFCFLPTYAPTWNVCEFYFCHIKNTLRKELCHYDFSKRKIIESLRRIFNYTLKLQIQSIKSHYLKSSEKTLRELNETIINRSTLFK